MTARLVTERIRTAAHLAALQSEWWDLWARAAPATPFQSPAWLISWWRSFTPGELRTIAVRHRGRLVGLAPLYLEAGALGRRILPLGISLSDYTDILADGDWVEDVCAAVAAELADDGVWQAWEFTDLAPDSAALRLPSLSGCRDVSEPASACPFLDLPADSDAVQEVFPTRMRRNLRMALNRAARRGGIEIVAADRASAGDALAELIRLHRARWQSQGEAGVMADPRVHRLHAAALPGLMSAGLTRLYTLKIAGEPAAVYYGFLHRGRAYAYLMGFAPAFDYESPGTILLGHAIVQAAREGARTFDMLRGQEPYKYRWGASDRWTRRRIFAREGSYARAS